MRVLIVDDDAFVAQSLATILSAEADIDVVGLGGSGLEAVEQYRRLRPDVLLMLSEADLFLVSGVDLEHFLDDAVTSTGFKGTMVS